MGKLENGDISELIELVIMQQEAYGSIEDKDEFEKRQYWYLHELEDKLRDMRE